MPEGRPGGVGGRGTSEVGRKLLWTREGCDGKGGTGRELSVEDSPEETLRVEPVGVLNIS